MSDQREHDDEAFLGRIRTVLDESLGTVDERDASALRAARRDALAQPRRARTLWLPVGVAATASMAILAVALILQSPHRQDLHALDDLELLAGNEDLDMVEDFEFYLWMEDETSHS